MVNNHGLATDRTAVPESGKIVFVYRSNAAATTAPTAIGNDRPS